MKTLIHPILFLCCFFLIPSLAHSEACLAPESVLEEAVEIVNNGPDPVLCARVLLVCSLSAADGILTIEELILIGAAIDLCLDPPARPNPANPFAPIGENIN